MSTHASQLVEELRALEEPKVRAINEKHGDNHGINLTKLRAIAKREKTNHALAEQLWETQDPNARLLALLICKPKEFSAEQLDTMLRSAQYPKALDWLINYVVKKSPHAEELRTTWFTDEDQKVAAAGWALTTERVGKKPEGLNLPELLDLIEADMKEAPGRLQWAMNETLANIGINNADLRERALDIGYKLEVLKDYPTPPGCTSPFAPIWINEIVRRNEAKKN